MKEYIERETATEAAVKEIWLGQTSTHRIAKAINSIPAADVAPVVHGQWLDNEDYMFCSICGIQWYYCDNDTETFNYCPNCGAKMDGGADNG